MSFVSALICSVLPETEVPSWGARERLVLQEVSKSLGAIKELLWITQWITKY